MKLEIDPRKGVLPVGVHHVSWNDVVRLCGGNNHRREMLKGLKAALVNLRDAGCTEVILDGSFVTSKERPNDYDGAWILDGVNQKLLDTVLMNQDRNAMKRKYGGELFAVSSYGSPDDPLSGFKIFFQKDRKGNPKGILSINLGSIT